MDLPREFTLTDVRCFAGEQRARLRPITLLIGENSTGKTTFLGCYNALHQLLDRHRFPVGGPDFNQEPFLMGSFRDIVRARRGRGGRIGSFNIGLKIDRRHDDNMLQYAINTAFTEQESQAALSGIRCEFDQSSYLKLIPKDNNKLIIQTKVGSIEINNLLDSLVYGLRYLDSGMNLLYLKKTDENPELRKILEHISSFCDALLPRLPDTIPAAPLRSKPKRTYDPVREVASPEGDHAPMLMMRLNRTGETRWRSLHESLSAFGKASGMFSDIRVRLLGQQMGDPFQLQVKARSSTPANIMDVGYGVSQNLPILVDIYSHHNSVFLLQQPEVHLHPRAQAELATIFANSAQQRGNVFMIETHSDYIVDRIRILVRQGKILAEDVSILYFEPVKNAVQIHSIELDSHGNLEHVPPGYRDFFLRESDRLLGFED